MATLFNHPEIRVIPGQEIKINPVFQLVAREEAVDVLDSFPLHVVGIGKGLIGLDRQYELISQIGLVPRPTIEQEIVRTGLLIGNHSRLIKAAQEGTTLPKEQLPVHLTIAFSEVADSRAPTIRLWLVYEGITYSAINHHVESLPSPRVKTDLWLLDFRDPQDGREKPPFIPANPNEFNKLGIYVDRLVENSTLKRFPI